MFEVGNVDRLEGLCKDVIEASLRDTTCQRHLAAFEADADAAAGTCLLALVAAACGLAVAGCMCLCPCACQRGWSQLREKVHVIYIMLVPPYSFSYLEEIADLGDLAPGLGVVGLNGLVADLVQSEGVCGRNVLIEATVQALDELNLSD